MTDPLFNPLTLGDLTLNNRVLMAPLTRCRSTQPGDIPNAMNAEYYRQRAGAGLIISEATQISPQGKGYALTPGIHSKAQVEGWRNITDAVHKRDGKIFAQVWHVGRISHRDLQASGELPVAPSAIAPKGAQTFIEGKGMVDLETPRALETAEIPGIVDQYRTAAQNAKDANFDGVEIHGANGYLLHQFTCASTNHRTDDYGGSLENRLRLPIEVAQAVTEVFGPGRVGYRISPYGTFNDMHEDNPTQTYTALAKALGNLNLAYLHAVEAFAQDKRTEENEAVIDAIRDSFKSTGGGAYIGNGSYTADLARERIKSNKADAVAFGVPYIANPDLAERFKVNAPLNEPDRDTFYSGSEEGYTDYPTMQEAGVSEQA